MTNLDKVLYPAVGTTKGDVVHYYATAAPALLPVLADRAVTRKRWPDGVGADGSVEPFFTKNLEAGAPAWIPRQVVAHIDRPVDYPLADSTAVLVWFAQMAALELHVPQWVFQPGSPGRRRVGDPTRMVFDLDPGPGVELAQCAQVALWVRELLADAGSDAVPVTSGSKGVHLYVPLDAAGTGARTSDQVTAVAKAVAETLEQAHPKLITSKMAKSVRPGRVFIDWSQNSAAKTTIAPYSLRGRERPLVAAPRTWEEIADPALQQLDLHQVLQRLDDGIDPWADMFGQLDTDDSGPEPDSGGDAGGRLWQRSARRSIAEDAPAEPSAAAPAGARSDAGDSSNAAGQDASGGAATMQDEWVAKQDKMHGSHRWGVDPLEGPRGRVVRRDFRRSAVSGRAAAVAKDGGDGGSDLSRWAPMLATAGDAALIRDQAQWQIEGKWDGIRALAVVDAAQEPAAQEPDAQEPAVRLVGRSGRELTAGYPELAELADVLAGHRAVLDGEIVVLEGTDGGTGTGAPGVERTSFPLLQQRMNLVSPAQIARMAEQLPVRYFAFDLLEIDGIPLVNKPLADRRQLLTALELESAHVHTPPAFTGDLADAMRASRERRWEGVVVKRLDSTYRPGTRSGNWLKLKNQQDQEVVLIGFKPGEGRREGVLGSIALAVNEDGKLRYAGRVGTGFSDRVLVDLTERLLPLQTDSCPVEDVPRAEARGMIWVRPELVGEVTFGEWTPDHHLRAASWRGLRRDKNPSDVVRDS
nr:non-homologous end-joining DNA ligase [Nakamurella aerolata]